jgi:hypothetical protein
VTTGQIQREGGRYAYLAVSIIIAGVLISASIVFAVPDSVTITKTDASISTTTLTVGPTTSENTNTSIDAALLLACSQSRTVSGAQNPSGVWDVFTSTNQPVVICLQLYYYNPTAPVTVNVSQALFIHALTYIPNGSSSYARSFSGASNFTVMSSQNQLVLGGPNNENEGAILAYSITAKPGASGTYELSFIPSAGTSNLMLDSQEPLQCGYYGQLVAGNGQPNYVQITQCITYTTTNQDSASTTTATSSDYHTIPGIQYPLLNDLIYFRAAGVANSAQTDSVG